MDTKKFLKQKNKKNENFKDNIFKILNNVK